MLKDFMNKHAFPLSLILIAIILTPIFFTPLLYANDGAGYGVYVLSLFEDGDLDLENNYQPLKENYPEMSYKTDEDTGLVYNQYLIGTPMLWAGGYQLAYVLDLIPGVNLSQQTYITFMVAVSAIAALLLGLLPLYFLLKDITNEIIGWITTLIIFLGTNIFFYMYLQPSMSHAISFGVVTGTFVWWWFRLKDGKGTFGEWIIYGYGVGLSTIIRPQNILHTIIPLIYFIFNQYKELDWGQIIKGGVSFVVFTIPVSIQLFVWKYLRGEWFPFFNTIDPHGEILFKPIRLIYLFFSGQRGLFIWTPMTILGVIGLVMLYRKSKLLSISLCAAILLQLYPAASWIHWWGGAGFANRYLISSYVYFAIGLAVFLSWLWKKYPFLVLLSTSLFIMWNFNLMLLYGSRTLGGWEPANVIKIIKLTITESIPKGYYIIKQFIFDRGSFLK